MTSERKTAQTHTRNLKEYFTSMDMRIMNSLQNDVPTFQQKRSEEQDTIRSIMLNKGLSLE